MPAYAYVALDARGRAKKGILEGDTPRQVRQLLRDQGLVPTEVDEVSGRVREGQKAPSGKRHYRARLSATELALVTRQIATLAASGLPLEEALGAVARQAEKARAGRLLMAVRARVLEGHSLADALGEFPRVFPELYRATVRAGEQSGHLDIVLERLADYTENRQVLRQRVTVALFYPLLLTIASLAIVAGLLTYVVPKVVQVFEGIGQELPPLTQGLIAVSEFLQANGLILLVILVLTVIGVSIGMRRPGFQRAAHRIILRMPLAGRLTRGLNASRYARTFSILTASGVQVLEGLRISAQVIANRPMREAVEQAAVRVREGASINRALGESGLFPPMTVQLIASGEASGQLENMLERAAQHQERETETIISGLLGLFEPLLILVMGAVVLVIVLAILLPIFDLNQLVR